MKLLVLLTCFLCAGVAMGQMMNREPSIGYVYPAGGQKGSVVHMTVGGQNLRGVSAAYVSGQGVNTVSITYVPPLNGQQRKELQRRLEEIREKRRGIVPGRGANPSATEEKGESKPQDSSKVNAEAISQPEKPVVLPDHPLLRDLENLGPRDLKKVVDIFLMPFRRLQTKPSIQEMVLVDIQIEPDAQPGNRELRLLTPRGLTNPVCFQVGTVQEIAEEEPNDPPMLEPLLYDVPVLFNGQIMPGDADRFRFRARRGESLVIEVQARQLIPYMPDAVPGWFQAVMTLYDSNGKELVYADDYRFSPDPVIFYNVPEDGEYIIEIRDAIYRGREDFVYRLYIGEKPFITHIFPMGGKAGIETSVSVSGLNIPGKRMLLDTSPDGEFIRKAVLSDKNGQSNTVLYGVDNLPEYFESEPNDSINKAEKISLPQTVNGRIEKPGDMDVFRFQCSAGCEIVGEVYGRRLGSPIDSLLRLTDGSGRVLAWNDDNEDRGSGLNTHHADSYVSFKVPDDGAYFFHLSDVQGHGGDEYAYRLRISLRRPDFDLRVTPSAINLPVACTVPIDVFVLRRDGFDGEIELSLKDAPEGFLLNGGHIPAGKNLIRATITAPLYPSDFPVPLVIEGRAVIDGKTVTRPAIPAEEMMQAFEPRHLVPTEKLVAAVMRATLRTPVMTLSDSNTLKIQSGGSARIQVRVPSRMRTETFIPEIKEPPAGISLGDTDMKEGLLTITIKAEGGEIETGFEDNLIVEIFTDSPVGPADEKGVRAKERVSRGFLPAIPFEIVRREN